MPDDDGYEFDAEVIRTAYAEKVKDAFKVFAENLGAGQNQKSSIERFVRALELVRKARDLALESVSATVAVQAEERPAERAPSGADGLSAEDQAMIEHALAGTTGQKPVMRR
jgi:hypothetical protein